MGKEAVPTSTEPSNAELLARIAKLEARIENASKVFVQLRERVSKAISGVEKLIKVCEGLEGIGAQTDAQISQLQERVHLLEETIGPVLEKDEVLFTDLDEF